ncbi:hypothetical protein GCM10009780_19060 [Actinomadura alba]
MGPLQLLDPNNQLLCHLVVTETGRTYASSDGGHASDGRLGWSLNDPTGTTIATLRWVGRFRGGGTYTLQFHYQLPEPLGTLVEMTPIAITLRQST